MAALVVFTVGYTVALFAYGVSVESPLTFLYTGINTGLLVLFAFLHRGLGFSTRALWVASVVGLGNMLGGVLLVDGQTLYLTEVIGPLGYDKVFHFLAAAGMAPVAWEAVARSLGAAPRTWGRLLVTWLVVNGGGAVVEIAEFVGSKMGGVNVGDYTNNALDLVANASGALVGVAILALGDRGDG